MLNAQTGKLPWSELQRHFARGVVLLVAADLDLIETASRVIQDDKEKVQHWLDSGQLQRTDLNHARAWESSQPEFWAVVAAPWVLVQEIGGSSEN